MNTATPYHPKKDSISASAHDGLVVIQSKKVEARSCPNENSFSLDGRSRCNRLCSIIHAIATPLIDNDSFDDRGVG